MPAKDRYHDCVKQALIKDGWIVTKDPFIAEKKNKKIAVEIKTFIALSEMNALENALGQYLLYRSVMRKIEPDRSLYLAIPSNTYIDIFEEPIGRLLREDYRLLLIVFDVQSKEILEWIPCQPTAN